MNFLILSLLYGHAIAHSTARPAEVSAPLWARDDCTTNPDWQPTQSAWISGNTDQQLASWWQSVSSKPHQSFANELGKGFGGHLNSFQCGILDYSTCAAPTCSDYQGDNDPAWSYLSILSVVNLNTFFNSLYVGVSNGQQDYSDLTNQMALTFFPWKNPSFPLEDASFWIVALLTALFAIPGAAEADAAIVGITSVSAGAFVAAGVQQITQSLQPGDTETGGLAKLDAIAEEIGTSSRQSIENWANTTFSGEQDSQNKTILDYLYNGSFVSGNFPSHTEIEQFYKAQMVSRTINAQWSTQKIFLTFFQTDDRNDTSGPNQTRWYSEDDGGVYYLYRYSEDGILSGYLDKPWGLDQLNGSDYGIVGSDITKAAARAFRVGGFNYTQDMAQNRIVESISSHGALTPFEDGASWEGTWTLPVCDMGTHNWNSQYGNKSSRYGVLPCCCGPSCADTKNFTKAANMHGFQTLLRGCKAQLKGSDVKYKDVDYGFGWKRSFPLWFAELSKGQKAGVILGFIFSWSSVIFSFVACG